MREFVDAFRAAKFAFDMVRYGVVKRAVTSIVLSWSVDKPQYSTVDYQTLAEQGYALNTLVWACIREIATSAAEAPLRVYERTVSGDERELPGHPLRQLIRHPNPYQTEFEFFEDTLTLLNIAGNAYIELERNRSGQVVGLWPIRPDRMAVIAGDDRINGYIYFIGDQSVFLPKQDVIHIKYPHPYNDYYGMSPIAAAAHVIDIDNAAVDFVKMFFDNGAVPLGIFKTRRRIDQIEADRIKGRWKERLQGQWHDIAVIDAEGDYQQVGVDLDQLDLTSLTNMTESRICAAFGVPPVIVGANVGLERSTYSNYSEARRHLWDETLVPIYVRLAQKLDVELRTEFDGPELGSVYAAFDLSQVRALQEKVDQLWSRAANALRAGGITINMFLSVVGLDRLGEEGDVFLFPANAVPVHASQLERFMSDDTVWHLSSSGGNGVSPNGGIGQAIGDETAKYVRLPVSTEALAAIESARQQHAEAYHALSMALLEDGAE